MGKATTQTDLAKIFGRSQRWVSGAQRRPVDPMPRDAAGAVEWGRRMRLLPEVSDARAAGQPPLETTTTAATKKQTDADDQQAPQDPHALLLKVLTDVSFRSSFTAEQQRTFATIAAELRRKDESDAKAASYVKPEDVIEMLQDHRALYVEVIDESAVADSEELVRHIRAQLDVDLHAKNIAAARIIEGFMRERANKLIEKLSKRVEEQVSGVRLLNLGGAS